MTSQQVQLTLVSLVFLLSGCSLFEPRRSPPLVSPYPEPRVVAVVPFVNESGMSAASGQVVADALTKTLDQADGLVALPVNRVLAGMERLDVRRITSPGEARALMRGIGADCLVVGTITAYDPYDPPTIGLAAEVYEVDERQSTAVDLRGMTRAGSGLAGRASSSESGVPEGASSSISAVLDASDPRTRDALMAYAVDRGPASKAPDAWVHHQRNMNLYIEFACHELAGRLLLAEAQRLGVPLPAGKRGIRDRLAGVGRAP